METYEQKIQDILKTLPDDPGVYIMKDESGEVIYVGKAKNLKNRVRQYFHSHKNHSSKVIAMVRKIRDIQYIIVDSEMEALILEANLIKKHRPHYNILMKDDKQYPYVRIDRQDPYPRVQIVRKVKKDGAKYFGPFLAAGSVAEILDTVSRNFPLRTCKKDILKSQQKRERPCLNYQIGRCSGPCANKISQEDYAEIVEQVCAFLQGKYDVVVEELRQKMEQASAAMEYEQAALWRDRMQAVERVIQRQKAAYASLEEWDVFSLGRLEDEALMQVFLIRDGKLLASERYPMEDVEQEPDREVVASFIKQYYLDLDRAPKLILVQQTLGEEQELIERWLSEKRGSKVQIVCPERGEKKKLVQMAQHNAIETLEKEKLHREQRYLRNEGATEELARAIGMMGGIHRMECYDISHTQGVYTVASMVVFIDGKPEKKAYRRFRIQSVEGIDDFKSMREVITRRLNRAMETDEQSVKSFGDLPDLMVIDGGKGQLSSAQEAMHSLGFEIPMIGLAKRLEEIFLPNESEPVILDKHSPALHVLQRIRDEAHRFAITYHRSLRANGALVSELDQIPGIGPKRKKELLKEYKSIEQIKGAALEELLQTEGLDRKSAEAVYAHFHPDGCAIMKE